MDNIIKDITKFFLEAPSVVDTAISYIFKIFPNNNNFSFLVELNSIIGSFFSELTEMLTPLSYFFDLKSLLYYFSVVFWLEITYIIIRILIWGFVKIVKI